MKIFHFTIISPYGHVFESQVNSIVVPGKDGYLGILADHRPLVALVKQGIVEITLKEGEKKLFAISSGSLEMTTKNEATLLVDNAKSVESKNIDLSELEDLIRV